MTLLRCQEKQMLKMADLIKTALDVGCEELPSGCDEIQLPVDPNFIENNISNSDQQQPVRFCLFVRFFASSTNFQVFKSVLDL